jgi:hypothetical protein
VDNALIFLFLVVASVFAFPSISCFADDSSGERNHIAAPDRSLPEDGRTLPPESEMTAFEPQQNPNNRGIDDQMRLIPISAPGSDASVFVPGTTVDTFAQFRFFRAGTVLFRPSARASYSYESNFLNLQDNHGDGRSYRIEPTLEAYLPIGEKGIRLDYAATYRDYRKYSLRHKWSHEVNADSRINLSPLISIAVREHFLLSSSDTRESAPGREILFSDTPFERNDVGLQMDWELGISNTLSLTSGWNNLRFKDSPSKEVERFYDYDQYRFGASFRRDVTPTTGVFIDGSYLRVQTDDPREITDSGGFEAVAGVSAFLTPLTSGQFSIGVRKEKYRNGAGLDFLGLVFRGALLKEFTENTRLSVAVARNKHLSSFQQNAYYVTDGLGISYAQDLGPNVNFTISPGYQRNRYAEPLLPGQELRAASVGTEHRVDRLVDAQASMRFRFNQLLAFEIFLDGIRRYSNLPGAAFTNYRAGVTLLLGERGITRGRMFY